MLDKLMAAINTLYNLLLFFSEYLILFLYLIIQSYFY